MNGRQADDRRWIAVGRAGRAPDRLGVVRAESRRLAASTGAQGTVEYALTLIALLAIVIALAALWRAGEDGVLARLAQQAASHGLEGTGPLDIALF